MSSRPSFHETVGELGTFLRSQGASDRILWLPRERITGRGVTRWIFRPEELTDSSRTAARYEQLRASSTSIRLDSLAQVDGCSLVYLENYGGTGAHLNFGILTSPLRIRIVRSKLVWAIVTSFHKMVGESAWLKTIQ